MAMKKHYSTADVRALMRSSEGAASPVTTKPAHAQVFHAKQSGPDGAGTTAALMRDRTHKRAAPTASGLESNTAFKNRGGTFQTSAFANVLQQADAVTQVLNSIQGQRVLDFFDKADTAGLPLRATVELKGIKEAGFLPESADPRGQTVKQTDAEVRQLTSGGVRVILDRGAGQTSFVIQTCFPLETLAASSFKVTHGASPAAPVLISG